MPNELKFWMDQFVGLHPAASKNEAQIEAAVRTLFIHCGFCWTNTYPLTPGQIGCQVNSKDIALQLTSTVQVIGEVKKPSDFNSADKRNAAICQAARYMTGQVPYQKFGIVTDGMEWIFFELEQKSANFFEARRFLAFNIESHSALALLVLERCRPNTMHAFLKNLSDCHQTVNWKNFESLMNHSLDERVAQLVKDSGKPIPAIDRSILATFYYGGFSPTQLVAKLLENNAAYGADAAKISNTLKLKKVKNVLAVCPIPPTG